MAKFLKYPMQMQYITRKQFKPAPGTVMSPGKYKQVQAQLTQRERATAVHV